MRFILLALLIFNTCARADPVKNLSELALLPHYCWGTQQVREVSKDPTPIEQYVAIYGFTYYHLHHYCWALNTENNAIRMHNQGILTYSLDDYKYVLDRAPSSFVFLPEIYTSRARVFFILKRDAEAAMDLVKAIQMKHSYAPAYARLSEYYQRINDKKDAIKTLEDGLSNVSDPKVITFFIRRLKEMDSVYQGTPGSSLPKEIKSDQGKKPGDLFEKMESAGNDQAATLGTTPISAKFSTDNIPPDLARKGITVDQSAKPNSYCRFCP